MPVEGVDRASYLAARFGTAERVAEAHAELKRQGAGERHRIPIRFDRAHAEYPPLASAHSPRGALRPGGRGQGPGHARLISRKAATSGISRRWSGWESKRASRERESRSALILRAGQDGVIAAERHAAVLGITGVPTFIFDGLYTISGAQDVGTLTRVFDQVAEFAAARDVAS